ncbi:MAG TPA: acyl-CoA thioesterase [Spirochaetota bacterium]|nr:acyl-CoA thioesterase [Spirochaetota bacterium]HPJ38615.1 acyl-CoA thioesterase [Spirochaetota bacterium]HPQ55201.1 acyl-CoA thioesterase [Spirochaetota bacterium]
MNTQENRESRPFTYTFTVSETHIDAFGHVNNAAYLQLFEDARWDIISSGGYGLKEIQEHRKGPVILEVTLKYRKEILPNQVIRIDSRTKIKTERIYIVAQQMFNEQNELCCEAVFTGALFDLEKRKIIPPTEIWLKAIGL